MQLLVEIPEEQIRRLDDLGHDRNASRDQLVQEAIAAYLPAPVRTKLLDFFGVLKGQIEDGQVFQDRMRREWDRDR